MPSPGCAARSTGVSSTEPLAEPGAGWRLNPACDRDAVPASMPRCRGSGGEYISASTQGRHIGHESRLSECARIARTRSDAGGPGEHRRQPERTSGEGGTGGVAKETARPIPVAAGGAVLDGHRLPLGQVRAWRRSAGCLLQRGVRAGGRVLELPSRVAAVAPNERRLRAEERSRTLPAPL